MKRWPFVAVVVGLALTACGQPTVPSTASMPQRGSVTPVIASDSQLLNGAGQQAIPNVGDSAPDFQYTLPDGTTHTLSQLRGKKVLINFWGAWCAPCHAEMPDMQKLLPSYGGTLVVLGINRFESVEVMTEFANKYQLTFPLIRDPGAAISTRYGVTNIPRSYFVTSDGLISFENFGQMTYDFMKLHIDQLK
jgi:peroxiredoxin